MSTAIGDSLDPESWDRYQRHVDPSATWDGRVLGLRDGRIAKVFAARRPGAFAGSRRRARAFLHNAAELARRGVACPAPEEAFEVPERELAVVVYRPVPGVSLRDAGTARSAALDPLADFFARLHAEGVYFRAAHPGNLIARPDGGFALIDVGDVRFFDRSLSPFRRARNLRRLLAADREGAAFDREGRARFLRAYLRAAKLGACAAALLRVRLALGLRASAPV